MDKKIVIKNCLVEEGRSPMDVYKQATNIFLLLPSRQAVICEIPSKKEQPVYSF